MRYTRAQMGYCSACNSPREQPVYEFDNCVSSSARQYNPTVCKSCLEEAIKGLEKVDK